MKKTKGSIVDLSEPKPIRVKSKYARMSKSVPIEYPNYQEQEIKEFKESFKPFKLLNLDMLYESGKSEESYPVFTDPQSGLKTHGKITQVKWLEFGRTKIGDTITESVRQRRIAPDKLKTLLDGVLKKVRESNRPNFQMFMENGFFDFDGGFNGGPTAWPAVAGLPTGTFIPYPPGPLTKQLYLQDMWQMQAKAFQIYNHDPLAHGAVEMLSAFVIGDGVKIQSKPSKHDEQPDESKLKKCQEVWDEFEERVEVQHKLPDQSMMLSVNGELMWDLPEISVEGKPGFADFISKDPGTCWEKITKPDDNRDVIAYYFNYPTRYLIVTKDSIPTTEYIVEMIAPERIIHVLVNVQENEVRGRSDLFSCLSSIKMRQDMLRYRVIKVINAAGIMIVHTIKGDDTDVSRIADVKTGFTGAGTEYYTNESEKVEVMKGADSERSKSGLHEEITNEIGTGIGMPGDYLGTGGAGTRAAALTATEPAAKIFRKRQKKFDFALRRMYKRVIQIAKKYGRLPKDASEECECIFPEIASENTKEKLINLDLALQGEAITHEEYTAMVRKELDITGKYEYEEIQKQIQDDKAEKLKNDPTLAAMYQSPNINPDTGRVMPNKPGAQPAPSQPNAVGKDKSKGTYNGDKSGLSNDSKNQIKKSLQSMRERNRLKLIEVGSVSALGALLRHEQDKMKQADFKLSEMDQEVVPPGWEPTVKKMKGKGGIDNPYALSWWMYGQGYDPAAKSA